MSFVDVVNTLQPSSEDFHYFSVRAKSQKIY